MTEVKNPYIAGSPISEPEMFFGRQDVFEFIQQKLIGRHQDNILVLYGQRRTGKTSILKQLPRILAPKYLCIFIDLHSLALNGIDGFLWELANYIALGLRKDYQIQLSALKQADFNENGRAYFVNDFLESAWSAIGDRHLLLMIDEAVRLREQVQAGKLEKEVFDYLRSLMQKNPRLNFLFSLGSGLEEMEKEYAFLFNVALYKRISFLDRAAAIELIKRPAQEVYQVEPEAIEKILSITSGHPYFTQLVCHSLFNHAQVNSLSKVTAKDVTAVLDESAELGQAVLKHVWDDSSPMEKVVLAGMTAAMGEANRPVKLKEIQKKWHDLKAIPPVGEMVKAIHNLENREVINGERAYRFTIDLERRHIREHCRLEWVGEEIKKEHPEVLPPVTKQKKSCRTLAIGAVSGVILLIILSFAYEELRSNSYYRKYREEATLTQEAWQYYIFQAQTSMPTINATQLAEGFFIINVLSGKCIDPEGYRAIGNETPLQLNECDMSENYTDQRWRFVGNGYLQNVRSGRCLEVKGLPGINNEDPLQLWDCEFSDPEGTDQRWEITEDGFIRNVLSGKCIDVKGQPATGDGAPLQLWDCEYTLDPTDQRWFLK